MKVKLTAAGFKQADELALKFFILYQLCQEQLSQQIHYDFGLRNILSVLRTCGQQRRDSLEAGGEDASEKTILLRVLRDMNKSKLVDEDVPLFFSLTEDLFPDTKVKENKYDLIENASKQNCKDQNLIGDDGNPNWFRSIIQLYETHQVRHGIMILGPSTAGKSSTIYSLARSMQFVSDTTYKNQKFTVIKMNPKAITAPQMFGRLDSATNDWTDGIFSVLWRRACKKEGEWIWILLNGPVDAVWIENLNTVLDDNKTLTLANSDRIPMSNTLKLMFEVDSLDNASPATVSRAGMIYMSGFRQYGWTPFFESWLKDWKDPCKSTLSQTLDKSGLVKLLFEKIELDWNPVFKMQNLNVFRQFMHLFTSLIYDGTGMDSKLNVAENRDVLQEAVQSSTAIIAEGYTNTEQALFQSIALGASRLVSKVTAGQVKKMIVYCIIWSFGAILNGQFRKSLQDLLYGNSPVVIAAQLDLPKLDGPQDNIYNYYVSDSGEWQKWSAVVPKFVFPEKSEGFGKILIPTVDNTCMNQLISKLNRAQFNVLLTGESGSGKTKIVQTYLANQNKDEIALREINFSSATTMGILQNNIAAFIDKRTGTTYGPPNNKRGIVFIDEINIPEINSWRDQPTNELTRQIIEERGYYSLAKPGEFHNIQDLTFIGAMPLPGGGRNDIPDRLKSHFDVIAVNLPNDEQLDMIFGTILKNHYKVENGFQDEVCSLAAKLTTATRKIWLWTKKVMLPTPSKFHYIFNLRDLSRITEGLIKTESAFVNTARQVVHVWANECFRILPDKFTSDTDIESFNKEIVNVAKNELQDAVLAEEVQAFVNQGHKDTNGDPKFIYIADFMRDAPENEDGDTNFEADIPKVYEPIYEKPVMIDRILQFQTRYNEFNKRNQLDLVLFDQCLQHILRISRVIRNPGGNCLLVGVGGSGKQSCARLATFIADYSLFQLVMNKSFSVSDLDDALRKKIKEVGIAGKGCSFIFTDNDIKDEIFLERINNLLTTGEIPALFPKEDVEDIINSMRDVWKRENPRKDASNDQLWAYFTKRARDNLHIILCFSPANAKFRSRSQKFPGIISGSVCDWFQSWPRDALEEVARKLLVSEMDIKVAEGSKTIENLVEFVANIHSSMGAICDQYFESYRRRTFVTPKSYLSFLATFKKLYKEKGEELTKANNRLSVGLSKIEEAGQTVKKMQETLNKQNKVLEQKSAEVQEKMKDVKIKTDEAEKVKAAVKLESDKCSAQAAETKIQEAGAQEGVDKAQPEVDKAEAALLSISKPDIDQIMGLATPPNVITRVVDMSLVIFNEKLDKVGCDMEYLKKNGQQLFDTVHPLTASWVTAKLVMQRQFLERLKNFNKNSITNEQCELLEAYIYRMSDLREGSDAPAKASTSIAGLHNWCISMHKYHNIMLDFEPKLILLRDMRAKLKFAEENLKKANELLAEKEGALKILNDALQIQKDALQALNDEAELTKKRMTAASKLIEGLSDERVRWGKSLKEIDDARIKLVGDVSLAAAFLSYCGPFNQDYRTKLITQIWIKDMSEKKIPYTKNIENNLTSFLTTEDVIGTWRLQGLPTDDLSTQNGLIVTSATRYPLLVDPQNQAATWIKNKYQDNLKVTTLTNKYFKNIMEDCLSQGIPVLIEDVEEELDPILDPILEKQFQKKGRGFIVTFGDNKEQSVMDGFTLFITTKLPNPKYSPEIYAKTSLIDFTVTFGGLEAQLLSRIVNIERRDLEDQRKDLLQKVNEYKKKMLDLEDQLLYKLVNSQGDIVDDSSLIETLNETKKTTEETKQKIAGAQETEKKINEARMEYEKAATRGSIIYFLICDMSNVNNMYQTSLKQFLDLFDLTIDEAEANQNPVDRINNIINHMTFHFFRYISRGLFEKDRLLFILNLCLKIQMMAGTITQGEFMIFMRGGAMLDSSASNRTKPANCNFLTQEIWSNIIALSMSVPTFSNIITSLTDNAESWIKWYESENPEDTSEKSTIPADYAKIKPFERMLLLRCFRQDRTMLAVGPFIAATLSPEYNAPFTADYAKILLEGETNPDMPVCFLLSLGSDPTGQLDTIARKAQKPFRSISMGQGQEENARKLLRESVATGGWFVINNSHLALKFMIEIDNIIADIRVRDALTDEQLAELAEHKEEKTQPKEGKKDDKKAEAEVNIGTGGVFNLLNPKQRVHKDFRLIITTEPHPDFPIGLLQKCIKLTNDPPSGIRAGLMRTYAQLSQETLENYADRPQYLPLVYAIAFIHSCLIERKKFGPLGWCIQYEFGQHDFNASIAFLQTFFSGLDSRNKQAKIESYKTIHYMVAEVHYGGRITDNYDRRLMNTYVAEWVDNKILDPGFLFGGVQKYSTPYYNQVTPTANIEFVRKFIMDNLSEIDKPNLMCMHPNAEITFRLKQAGNVLATILSMQPRESSAGKGGMTREQMVDKYAKDMLPDVPENFDLKREVPQCIETLGGMKDSLNVFLRQEIMRMQTVLTLTKVTLNDLQQAIAGQIVMTEALQDAVDSIANGNVPKAWANVSWTSPNLSVWRQVLKQRTTQFVGWMRAKNGERPSAFWLTGFFNCTGFLTSVKQEITRQNIAAGTGGTKWSLDKVAIVTQVQKMTATEDKETGVESYNIASLPKPPGKAVYIYGLFLEGAEWSKQQYLIEAKPKILFYPMPPIMVNAEDSTQIVPSKKAEQFYGCPVYKTPFRTGLTYIFEVKLACAPLAAANDKSKQDSSLSSPNTWILRGTALLCQTE